MDAMQSRALVERGNGHQRNNAAFLYHLADFHTAVKRAYQIQYFGGVQTFLCDALRIQPELELRCTGLRLGGDIARTRNSCDGLGQQFGVAVQQVQVLSKNFNHKFSGVTRHGFFNAFGQKRVDAKTHAGKRRHARLAFDCVEFLAYGIKHFFLLAGRQRSDFHFDFAVMHAEGVSAVLRAAYPLGDGFHALHTVYGLYHLGAYAQRFGFRGAGQGRHVNNVMAFAQLGHKFNAKQRQRCHAKQHCHQGSEDHRFG